MTTSWSVPRDWVGQTVAILASGPSMSQQVADAVRGRCKVIAVNNQGVAAKDKPAIAPWADVLYAADLAWWRHHQDAALRFAGLKVTVREHFKSPDVYSLQQSTEQVFDSRPTHIVTGANSGYQALHLAAHFGAARVLLCGYDMRKVTGQKHWFGDHPGNLNQVMSFGRWIQNFHRLAPVLKGKGIKVFNCTPESALDCFPHAKLQDALG